MSGFNQVVLLLKAEPTHASVVSCGPSRWSYQWRVGSRTVRGLAGCRLPVMVSAEAAEPWSTRSFPASLCVWQLQGSETCTGSMRKEGGSWVMAGSVSDRWLQGCGLKLAYCYFHYIYWSKLDTYLTNIWEAANRLQLYMEGSAKMTLRTVLIQGGAKRCSHFLQSTQRKKNTHSCTTKGQGMRRTV